MTDRHLNGASNNIINNSNNNNNSLSQAGFCSDNAQPRTLYVGNLDPSINEDFIHTLFAPFGRISSLKLINDSTNNTNDPYCFIEYEDNLSAANALMTMNKRVCLDREIKVNWATSPGNTGPKLDTSKHFHIFVGDLSPEIETQQLRDAFSPFGEISDCRVVRDSHTYKSKGYGFVSFLVKQDAELAITNMNGQWLGSRAIRTNWASRKPPPSITRNESQIGPSVSTTNRHLNFDEVYSQSGPSNCTVYCGGISNGLNEEIIHNAFIHFGPIQEVRVFKDKGYAFIKFIRKEAATKAIVSMHNQEILGQIVKCSWGKETIDSGLTAQTQMTQTLASPSLIYPYGQPVPYWYPQSSFPPGLQPGQPYAIQGSLQYPYNQYYGPTAAAQANHSNPAFNSSIGISINPTWQASNNSLQNVQSAHHLPVSMHQNVINSSIQQPLMGYPMQGYQAQ